MKIAFIGAGKVGIALGLYLNQFEHIEVVGYYSLHSKSAKKAATMTNSRMFLDVKGLIKQTETVAITTPDDQITQITEQIGEENIKNSIIFHTSGAHSSELLEPLYKQGATVLSMHPMLSFANPEKSVEELHHTFFTVEGKGPRLEAFYHMLNQLDNPWIRILPRDKTSYHAAAAIVSNYLVTLLDVGIEMYTTIGLTREQGIQLIKPLVDKTVSNIFEGGTEYALTGPIARGDIGTIQKHVNQLTLAHQDLLKLYRVLGEKTVDLAYRANKIDHSLTLKLKEALDNK